MMQRSNIMRTDDKGPDGARVVRSAGTASAATPSRSRGGDATGESDLGPAEGLAAQTGDAFCHDYRVSHQSQGYGAHYNKTYSSGYYAALWTKIEEPLLEDILRPIGGPDRKCLDFACGTGRIASVAAKLFGKVVGVDVSKSMLECAQLPQNVRLRHMDITRGHLGETFDVVTAFRFFLNAGDTLRREALLAMGLHLRERGWLVCNIHMNSSSPVGFAYRVANRMNRKFFRNTLSLDQFTKILRETGFTVEETVAYGYLPRPGRFMPKLCEALIRPTEKTCKALKIPARFAQNFIVIARKR